MRKSAGRSTSITTARHHCDNCISDRESAQYFSEARRTDGRTDEAQKRLSCVLIVENDQDVLHTLMTDLACQFSLVETAADSEAVQPRPCWGACI